jgi:hypothetical protein
MIRCAGLKQAGGVCSDALCDSKNWSPLTHYHHDGICGLCGKPALDVLVCDECGAIDKHDGYGRYADKDGYPCGRLYDPDEEEEVLAPDSDTEVEEVGYPLVKSPPLKSRACVCDVRAVPQEDWRTYKGFVGEHARCVNCNGWCTR